MRTFYDFIVWGEGTIEEIGVARTLSTLSEGEAKIEAYMRKEEENGEGEECRLETRKLLNQVRAHIAEYLSLAQSTGMDDCDFVLLNYQQYVGEPIVK